MMHVKAESLAVREILLIHPEVFGDGRGFFMEVWNERDMDEALGYRVRFVQDNHSRSAYGVIRGLHYQIESAQGKLVRVVSGEIFDVAVDLRRSSETFGEWVGVELSAKNKSQLWIPPGFAHGFLVLSDVADVLYKATEYYEPASERTIRWDDPTIGIEWPIPGIEPLVSDRDAGGLSFAQAPMYD